MGNASDYWTFLRLDPAGAYRTLERLEIKALLQQQFSSQDNLDYLSTDMIQSYLLSLLNESKESIEHQQLAALSLRCFISHQIVQTCTSLVNQFGDFYHFELADLLPLVLDDEGDVASTYPSLAQQTLRTFKPGSSSLSTWVSRLVRQHRELNQLLLEHGLYLISDWAILNDTPIDRLRRILNEFFPLTPTEIEQACHLLESYRAIYLPEHTHSRQCQPPTQDQLQRMSDRFQQRAGSRILPNSYLSLLQSLAKRLRQHRITVRTRRPSTQPIDDLDAQVDYQATNQDETGDPAAQNRFLLKYRQAFESALDNALQTVVQDRIQKAKKPEKRDRFQKALRLFHCQHLTMSAIAVEVGLPRQDSVTHLLKLKDFRADVKNLMLCQLKHTVIDIAMRYKTCDDLITLSAEIEAALDEQIEALIEAEAKRSKSPKGYLTDSVFSKRLCLYLDEQLNPP
ncbi:hypothetical protein ACKFKF_13005 [Phormidesmis sp. 146-12]